MSFERPNNACTLRSFEFNRKLDVAASRSCLVQLLENDQRPNSCFIPEENPHLFRIWSMATYGQIALTHCDLGETIGIRVNVRFR